MLRIVSLAAIVGASVLIGCAPASSSDSGVAATLPSESSEPARPAILDLSPLPTLAVRSGMLVSTDWLAEHLSDPDLVILHIGPPTTQGDGGGREAYVAGHIPGARFVPWSAVATTRDGVPNELPPLKDVVELARQCGITHRSRIVLYDQQAALSAARAYVAMDYLGLGDKAALLDGQWKKWQLEKRAVSFTEPTGGQVSGFVPRPRPETIIALPQMRDMVWARTALASPPIAIVDARPAEEFSGATPGLGIDRPGHIPGAQNIFSTRNLTSEELPTFKSTDELRAIYARAGALPGTLVITYCRTGGQASMAYFAARYLGHDVRIYDGSFYEWSRASQTQVVGPAAAP